VSPSATSKQSQPYTPRGSAVKKPTQAKKAPRLPEAARLVCLQKFHGWVHVDKKQTKSREPALRRKYLDLKPGNRYFYKLLEKNLKEGTIFSRPGPGRPPAHRKSTTTRF
jgi:hypothetical protein